MNRTVSNKEKIIDWFRKDHLGLFHPQTHYPYPPVRSYQTINYGSSGDVLLEKLGKITRRRDDRWKENWHCLETVTIEEEPRRYVRPVSPVIRQLRVRSRPSSSHNLHDTESTGKQATLFQ